MSDFPNWAQKKFSLDCSDGKAKATKPDQDDNGWDFFVEFPERPHSGPEETRPPIPTAFVQVKSKVGGKPTVKITLSNMLKACRSRQPWFVYLAWRPSSDAGESETIYYATHIWRDLIARSLKAVRATALKGKPLNKRELTISFGNSSKVTNIVPWMMSQIDAQGPDYEAKKRAHYEEVGYEESAGVGNLVIEADSEEQIEKAFLGLGAVQAKSFTFTPVRFGLPDHLPLVRSETGKLTITPKSIGDCEIRVKGPATEPAVILAGEVFGLNVPGIRQRSLRFSAPPLELIWREAKDGTFTLSFDAHEPRSLQYLTTTTTILRWADYGPLEVQVWKDGGYRLGMSGRLGNDKLNFDYVRMNLIVSCLQKLADARGVKDIAVTMNDLNTSAVDLGYMAQVLAPGSLRMEFNASDEVPAKITSLVYYTTATAGVWTFSCLVLRKVREDMSIDTKRRITSAAPQMMEVYVTRNVTEDQAELVSSDYLRVLGQLEETETPLGLGDMNAFIKTSQTTGDA